MSDLERIVRPSQSPDIRPATVTVLLKPPKAVQNNATVWGSSGNSIFDIQAHTQGQVNNKSIETKRTYDVVRVMNPDDPDQHVDVEVMTAYQARNKIDASRVELRFNKPQPSANTQIMSRNNVKSNPDGES